MKRVQEWEQKNPDKDYLDTTFAPKFKLGARTDKYLLCVQCGLEAMAEEFGLKPSELSENLTDYVKHEIRQNSLEPLEVAKNYICE